jgi:hypothetical protein
MTMLAMTILVHFWVLYWVIEPSTLTLGSNLRSAVVYVTIIIHTVPRNHRNASQNPSILLKVRVVTS